MAGYNNFNRKFGSIGPIVGTGKFPIWNGNSAYDGWIDTPSVLSVASDSADDAPGQGGATHVVATGLDASGQVQSEEIAIGASGSLLFSGMPCFTARVSQTEDGDYATGPNHGTITISAGATTCAEIAPTRGRTEMAIYRIPASLADGERVVSAVMRSWRAFPSARTFVIELLLRRAGTDPWENLGTFETTLSDIEEKAAIDGLVFYPGDDIMAVISDANGGNASAFFEIELKTGR
jgi:hypothetical protein